MSASIRDPVLFSARFSFNDTMNNETDIIMYIVCHS